MSFKPYTEKIKKKQIGICSILGRIRIRIQNRTRIRIHHPGIGSADPDPDEMMRIRNTERSNESLRKCINFYRRLTFSIHYVRTKIEAPKQKTSATNVQLYQYGWFLAVDSKSLVFVY